MAEHHRKKTPKLKAYWREKARRQYAAKKALRIEQMRINRINERRDTGRVMLSIYRAAKSRAKKNGMEFTITKEWVDQQPRMCKVSGISFVLPETGHGPLSPSIDRIDSSKGYTPENTQFVSFFYNMAKNKWGEQEIQDLIISYAEAFQKLRSVA